MLLKKQTVWLLTMLSLVVVLSIYYITSPEQASDVSQTEGDTAGKVDGESKDQTIISEAAGDEEFAQQRMALDTERSQKVESLQDQTVSAELSAEEVSALYDQISYLEEVSYREGVLETSIISLGFEDVLVKTVDGEIHVIVKANEPNPADANEIIKMVSEQMGSFEGVAVTFKPAE